MIQTLRCVCFVLFLVLCQCTEIKLPGKLPELSEPNKIFGSSEQSPCVRDHAPKTSPDASECLYLDSNISCNFSVDGKPVTEGTLTRVFVTMKSHSVQCKPDGYKAIEDKIDPPFDPYHPIQFRFFMGDKLPSSNQLSTPSHRRSNRRSSRN